MGREEIEVTGGEKGESKEGESNQDSDLAPKQKWVLKIGFLKVQS